jgi:hypothetical protein
LDAERTNHAKLEALRADNKTKEDKRAQELETLRSAKDARIRAIEREREDQRNTYELKINDLESKVRSKKDLLNLISRTKPKDPRAQLYHHRA